MPRSHEPLATPSPPRAFGQGFPSSGGIGGRIRGRSHYARAAQGPDGGWRSLTYSAWLLPPAQSVARAGIFAPCPENQAFLKGKGEAESMRLDGRVPVCVPEGHWVAPVAPGRDSGGGGGGCSRVPATLVWVGCERSNS